MKGARGRSIILRTGCALGAWSPVFYQVDSAVFPYRDDDWEREFVVVEQAVLIPMLLFMVFNDGRTVKMIRYGLLVRIRDTTFGGRGYTTRRKYTNSQKLYSTLLCETCDALENIELINKRCVA